MNHFTVELDIRKKTICLHQAGETIPGGSYEYDRIETFDNYAQALAFAYYVAGQIRCYHKIQSVFGPGLSGNHIEPIIERCKADFRKLQVTQRLDNEF